MSALPRPLLGWPLLQVPDDHGQLHWPGLEESVRQLVRVILSTRPGEQLMRPEFGAGLELLLHEPNTLATRSRMREWVSQALSRWEQRILLDRVDVLEVEGDPGLVRVEIGYRLARDGSSAALALTVQLEG